MCLGHQFKYDQFLVIDSLIGFFHEHTRSDRDQYITINWDNVPNEFKHNFAPCTSYHEGCQDSNVGYDYDSIMHYGKRITGLILIMGHKSDTKSYSVFNRLSC